MTTENNFVIILTSITNQQKNKSKPIITMVLEYRYFSHDCTLHLHTMKPNLVN